MKRWKVYLGLTVLFLSGVIVGSVGSGLFIRQQMVEIIHGGPQAIHQRMMHRLDSKLDLDAKQRPLVKNILNDVQKELLAIRLREQPQVANVLNRGVERIRKVLRPEQQQELDAMHNKLKGHFQRFDRFKKRGKRRKGHR